MVANLGANIVIASIPSIRGDGWVCIASMFHVIRRGSLARAGVVELHDVAP